MMSISTEMKQQANILLLFVLCFMLTAMAWAQKDREADTDAVAQANNPLANMKAFNVQNYYIGDLSGLDKDANQFWLRYAQPFSVGNTNWLMRASLPVSSFPVRPDWNRKTGMGDFNIFASYLFDMSSPAISFGVGPQLTVPTASKDELGSEKWSAGLANVLFNAESKVLQYGYLLTWQHSFAGNSDRATVNIAAFQPFAMLQLGGGTYLRAAPIWVYNLDNDNYSVPLGVGIGQVFVQDKTVYNLFVEPQFSIADKGAGQPEWQIYMGLNMQFMH